jgi:hypothetical protein
MLARTARADQVLRAEEVTATPGTSIEGLGLGGVLRLTWGSGLAHVLEHSQADEPAGVWTGLACLDHDLGLGAAVDDEELKRLSAHSDIADLVWEPPAELAAEHIELSRAAIGAHLAGAPEAGGQLWQQAQALWSVAWSANYQALGLLQRTGLRRFAPVRPQRWVVASYEHHCGPHGLRQPHIHNIVLIVLTTGGR